MPITVRELRRITERRALGVAKLEPTVELAPLEGSILTAKSDNIVKGIIQN